MSEFSRRGVNIQPFLVDVPDDLLKQIFTHVPNYPWDKMADLKGWEARTNLKYMRKLCAHWLKDFSWRKQETSINKFDHFIAPVDNLDIHFIFEKESGSDTMPLIISHGWLGTVVEFLDFIELLAHPERFGRDIADAFDVIIPSLPGFGFSQKPLRPIGPRKIAEYFNSLMTDVLGYEHYLAKAGTGVALS